MAAFGFTRVTVDYLYTPAVGIESVIAFTEISAALFDAWLDQTSKKGNSLSLALYAVRERRRESRRRGSLLLDVTHLDAEALGA
jgi:hypothetical protein